MDTELEPKSPKRYKVEKEVDETKNNGEKTQLNEKNANESTSAEQEPAQKRETDDVVVISSDDDSEKIKSEQQSKDNAEIKTEKMDDAPIINQTENPPKTSDVKKETPEKPVEELIVSNDKMKEESTETKPSSPGSPDECISQEDLLAHLGLGSVRAITNPKQKKDEKVSNGVLTERRPLIPHKPKESIVDLLRAPKLKPHDEKGKANGEIPVTLVNGVSDDDESAPGTCTPSETDDDELLAKEQLIEELRQELRNEEAKLLLFKKIQAAQNDPKGNLKYAKEKENEKLISSVQYSGSKSGHSQLSNKKNSSLPPPPPLKTHISTSGTYQPPVAIQPKILPKVSNMQSSQSSKQASQSQTKAQVRSGTSAIKDLQNVISSMSTNLIHPTPMYPRAGSQGGATVYTTQSPPVRPTPVRANNPSSGSSSTSYATFPSHSSSKASSSPPVSSAGKQAAAKMALRKQLEKTLLQIPPPKPPPADWSFIPNLNSSEFMTLVGFEMVVDSLKENAKKGKSSSVAAKPNQIPKICGQCSTDFTPCWKAKAKEGSSVHMCEKCSTVNVKKELKTEHTARLKAAFLKALKQEQEIEQKMSESTPIAPKPQSSTKTSSHQSSSSSTSSRHHHISHHQGVVHGSHRHRHVQGIYHHHQPHQDSLLYQLQQQHIQQQQQELEVAARRHGDVRWHPYMSGHHHSSHKGQHHHSLVSESDRQYLLDMIPSLPAQSINYSSSRI